MQWVKKIARKNTLAEDLLSFATIVPIVAIPAHVITQGDVMTRGIG
jgi:hypothetical protein